jgi:hypothetical protein
MLIFSLLQTEGQNKLVYLLLARFFKRVGPRVSNLKKYTTYLPRASITKKSFITLTPGAFFFIAYSGAK